MDVKSQAKLKSGTDSIKKDYEEKNRVKGSSERRIQNQIQYQC